MVKLFVSGVPHFFRDQPLQGEFKDTLGVASFSNFLLCFPVKEPVAICRSAEVAFFAFYYNFQHSLAYQVLRPSENGHRVNHMSILVSD